MSDDPPPSCREPEMELRIRRIATSFAALLGRDLVPPSTDPVMALWNAPFVIVAHGTEPDPVFFFGNHRALAAFETDATAFARMPSRLSAEVPLREERQALLARVSRDGFIDDYAGVRISAQGRRFRIDRAIVWNLVDASGRVHGQAATFSAPPHAELPADRASPFPA